MVGHEPAFQPAMPPQPGELFPDVNQLRSPATLAPCRAGRIIPALAHDLEARHEHVDQLFDCVQRWVGNSYFLQESHCCPGWVVGTDCELWPSPFFGRAAVGSASHSHACMSSHWLDGVPCASCSSTRLRIEQYRSAVPLNAHLPI